MFASLPRDWTTLQRMVKQLESEGERKVQEYASTDAKQPVTELELLLVSELEALFARQQQLVDQMESVLTPDSPSASFHLVQRHRDTLHLHLRDFRKLKANFTNQRAHKELLTQSQSDRSTQSRPNNTATDRLLEERIQIDRTTFMMDDLLSQAQETRTGLFEQRDVLSRAQRRLKQLDFLGLNRLLSQIRVRKYRNTLVLASVCAMALILLYLFH